MKIYSNKPLSNSHIWSNKKQSIVGKFTNGIFDTEDAGLVSELSQIYKTDEEIVETTVEVVENEPIQLEETDTEMKGILKIPFTKEELMGMGVKELSEIGKPYGVSYRPGTKKEDLVDKLLKLNE